MTVRIPNSIPHALGHREDRDSRQWTPAAVLLHFDESGPKFPALPNHPQCPADCIPCRSAFSDKRSVSGLSESDLRIVASQKLTFDARAPGISPFGLPVI